MSVGDRAWTVAEAKAHLSEVMAKAERHGPQMITRNGKPSAVVVSAREWHKHISPPRPLAAFLLEGPEWDDAMVESINSRVKLPQRTQEF